MKTSRKLSSFSSTATTTVIFNFAEDQTTPTKTRQIPVTSPPPPQLQPPSPTTSAATKIQSLYRGHLVRSLYNKISSVNREADNLQSLIQRQETVDAIRNDEREKLRMNESLMALLLKLDSVPGLDPTVREARRKVSRRIVEMQEILDSIAEARSDLEGGICGWWDQQRGNYWEEVVEEEMCRERGGEELERFCAQYLGFRCFQRFLRE